MRERASDLSNRGWITQSGLQSSGDTKIIGHISFDISHFSFEKARTSIKLFFNDK
jgi:hypothetical protein